MKNDAGAAIGALIVCGLVGFILYYVVTWIIEILWAIVQVIASLLALVLGVVVFAAAAAGLVAILAGLFLLAETVWYRYWLARFFSPTLLAVLAGGAAPIAVAVLAILSYGQTQSALGTIAGTVVGLGLAAALLVAAWFVEGQIKDYFLFYPHRRY